jgi:cell division protein FtsB
MRTQFARGGVVASLLLGGAAVVSLGLLRGASSLGRYRELQRSRDVLAATVDGLKRENDELAAEIMRLKKSPSYAKKVLRDKYHVTEPDEDIVFFAE